ncbi:hypothetical protein GF323_00670 [Candidatus Woesearchaeota archaeon]|nr:hypothetical protein [Candidatus Woesearchaeota archaeon]
MAKQKKRWFRLIAPKFFNEQQIGESLALGPDELKGRTLKANLSTLINNIRKQHIVISMLVDRVEGDKGYCSIMGMEISPASIKRQVRKRRTRLDQTLKAITKDGKPITLKLMLLTRNVIKGSVFTNLQKQSKDIVLRKIAKTDFAPFAEEVVTGRLQKEIKEKLNKIYPLRMVEVKSFSHNRFLKAVDLRKIKENIAKENRNMPREIKKEKEEDKEEKKEETKKKE